MSEQNKQKPERTAEEQMRQMSRRSFLWSAAAAAAGFTGWRWLVTRRDEDGIAWPFRRALETNEQLWRDLYKPARLAPTFPRNAAKEPRPNGDVGLSEDFDPSEWKLRVEGLASGGTLELILDDVKALPKVEMVTELKCIEGWSQIVHWGGARFADFAQKFPPATGSDYVYMETPDGGYYVGLDIESVLHPQTLLCYEMNGEPLTLEHGAPLRLVIPLKYGIKNIKRIGVIRFTDKRPADYWAERSYDWYAGH